MKERFIQYLIIFIFVHRKGFWMKKKLILINPKSQHRIGFLIDKESRYPPLGLAIVAALTPDNWEIKLIDENFEDFLYDDADLVGITSFTSTVTRAYEIASIYRKKNIPVVLGGIHASMSPDEAEKYVDVVAIGEAETVWRDIINDFEKRTLKKRYSSKKLITLDKMPMPRHDLFHNEYQFDSIQTTRGCPMQCEFCSVPVFNGRAYRMRPLEAVLNELELIKAKQFFFVDDNIVGYNKPARNHAKAIFRGMIEREIKKDWFCQASINFGDDEELLDLAYKAGCRLVLIGVESEKVDALQSMNKRSNLKAGVDSYQKIFSTIQQHGISVLGTFIMGLDTDSVQDIKNRTEYILNSNIDAIQISILTPFPGTKTYNDYKIEKRLTAINYPADWEKYWGGEIVIQPALMTPAELEESVMNAAEKIYNSKRMMQLMLRTLKVTGDPKTALWAFSTNAHYHNMVFETDIKKQIKLEQIFGKH